MPALYVYYSSGLGYYCISLPGELERNVDGMFDMKKKAKAREYTKIASDEEQPPCRFVCQPPKSDLRDGRKRLIVAILFCVFFIICEITGEIVLYSLILYIS